MMKNIKLLIVVSLLIGLASCGETIKKTVVAENVTMIEDYPFEGPNTITGIWEVDLNGINLEEMDEAKVKSIKMEMVEPGTSTILGDCIMQLAAEGTNMQRVAVLNPIPDDQQSFELSIAEEQENLIDLLKQKEITFVADINLEEEPTSGLSIKTTIEFEIEN
jgi:hypothetical protein